jgi:hypothetical protein
VLAGNQKGDEFHALTFSETEIQGVAEIDSEHSGLVLRSGAKIPVALSYEDLEQKVYSPNLRTDDSSVLDLRGVTGPVAKPKLPANINEVPGPGNKTLEGTVYAGRSPDTGEPMYASPVDAPLTMTFNEAAGYAKKLNQEQYLCHNDWRVPTRAELNVLFNNRAAIGGFNVSGSYPAGCYWARPAGLQLGSLGPAVQRRPLGPYTPKVSG